MTEEVNSAELKLIIAKMILKLHETNLEVNEKFGSKESITFLYEIAIDALMSMIVPKLMQDGHLNEEEFFDHMRTIVMLKSKRAIQQMEQDGVNTWQH